MVVPVDGQRILKFGQPTVYGGKSHGVVFQVAGGASVRAPATGVVMFAGEFRSYGDLLIVDACKSPAVTGSTSTHCGDPQSLPSDVLASTRMKSLSLWGIEYGRGPSAAMLTGSS